MSVWEVIYVEDIALYSFSVILDANLLW